MQKTSKPSGNVTQAALDSTLHCLTGCVIGEIIDLVLGTILGWSSIATIVVSIILAFLFGYSLSFLPLLKEGFGLAAAMSLVLAGDTLSILTMEVVDNAVVVVVPGAMNSNLVNPVFWMSLSLALFLAFWAAFPVNRWLLRARQGACADAQVS